jgi:hypothetical protein
VRAFEEAEELRSEPPRPLTPATPPADHEEITATALNEPTVLPIEPEEAGKGGKGGDFRITNAEFITAVFPRVPEGASAAVCSKRGNPDLGVWPCRRADRVAAGLAAGKNNYLSCASFYSGKDG